jgi:polysaccharide biosynthesis/export protein
MRVNKHHFLFLLLYVVFISSCLNTKKATYFNEGSDMEIEYAIQNLEPVIQKNDLLSITVSSLNAEANQLFNLYSISTAPGNINDGTVTQSAGYLVDQEGNIQFPMLGTLQVAGLTKKELKGLISTAIKQKEILFDPVVNIRYLNYKITVLGAVAHPAVFNVPNEKITLLESLGLAGDLTMFARRDNIIIIREEKEGKRVYKHVNLNDKDFLKSPYYYLRSNDIVYAAPNNANIANASTTKQWLPTVFGALSFMAIVIDRILK